MIDEPTVVQTEAQACAVIHLTIPREQIREVMGPAIGEVIAVATTQGVGPSGPVFSHHFKMDDATFDFDVGVPVAGPLSPSGRVRLGELPAARVAQTIYHGPYDGLGEAWGEFQAWVAARGLRPAPNLWERYVAGPESSPEPESWRTELNQPLLD